MTERERKSLVAVLNYLEDEEEHYEFTEEEEQENHIYKHVLILQEYLDRHTIPEAQK